MTLSSARYFVGRTEALEAYDSLWLGDGRRILNYTGMSGTGKTTLLWYLREHHDRFGRILVSLDLQLSHLRNGDHDLLDALVDQLAAQVPGMDWSKYHDAAAQLDSEAAAIRMATTAVNVHQSASKGSVIDSSPITVHLETTQRLASQRIVARQRLTAEVIASCRKFREKQCALFIDSFDVLQQHPDRQFSSWLTDELLPGLIGGWTGLRVIVAGREGLPYQAHTHRQSELPLWTSGESHEFLRLQGITDSTVRTAIHDHCHGHPLLTALALDVWEAGQSSGRPLRESDLRAHIDHQAATRWLFDLLLERLSPKLREALRAAALLRRLTLESLNAVLAVIPDAVAIDHSTFHRILSMSVIEHPLGDKTSVHDLIRQVEDYWSRKNEPQRFMAVQVAAQRYYSDEITFSLEDWLYHATAIHIEHGMTLWKAACDSARIAHNLRAQMSLLEVLHCPERWRWLPPEARGGWYHARGLLAFSLREATADDAIRTALGLFEEAGDSGSFAEALVTLGEILLHESDLARAEQSFRDALAAFQQTGNDVGVALAELSLGKLYIRTDRLRAAETILLTARDGFRDGGVRRGEAHCLIELGGLYTRTARMHLAEPAYRDALFMFRDAGDPAGVAECHQSLGELYMQQGRLDLAEADYSSALTTCEQIGNQIGAANARKSRGEMYMRIGRFAQAEADLKLAYTHFQRCRDVIGEANTLMAKGEFLAHTSRSDEAEGAYEGALTRFVKVEDRLGEANTRRLLGDLYLMTERRELAEAAYNETLELSRRIQDRLCEANTLLGLIELSDDLGDVAQALTNASQALSLFTQIPDPLGEANTHRLLGRVLSRADRIAESEAAFDQALKSYDELDDVQSGARTLIERGSHRIHHRELSGFHDWAEGLAVAARANSQVFEDCLARCVHDVQRLIRDGNALLVMIGIRALCDALDASMKRGEPEPVSRERLDIADAVLVFLGRIAYRHLAKSDEAGSSETLRKHAAGIDRGTNNVFRMSTFVRETLTS